MHILNNSFQPEAYRQRLLTSTKRVLMLDYDGTLAPFVEDRDKAFPYPGIRDMLERIRTDKRNRLVIVTGRAVGDIIPLLGLNPPPEIWGSHGYEHRFENKEYLRYDAPEAAAKALLDAAQKAYNAGLENRLEMKPLSIAIHWRGMDAAEALRIEQTATELWQPLVEKRELALHAFDGGLELRILGRTKGDAVRSVLAEYGNSTVYAYLGDDATDEDAFEALKGRGLSVLVRKEPRETRADACISPPEELMEWLAMYIEN